MQRSTPRTCCSRQMPWAFQSFVYTTLPIFIFFAGKPKPVDSPAVRKGWLLTSCLRRDTRSAEFFLGFSAIRRMEKPSRFYHRSLATQILRNIVFHLRRKRRHRPNQLRLIDLQHHFSKYRKCGPPAGFHSAQRTVVVESDAHRHGNPVGAVSSTPQIARPGNCSSCPSCPSRESGSCSHRARAPSPTECAPRHAILPGSSIAPVHSLCFHSTARGGCKQSLPRHARSLQSHKAPHAHR